MHTALEEFIHSLDEWAKAYLAEHTDRLSNSKPCEYRDCLQQRASTPAKCALS